MTNLDENNIQPNDGFSDFLFYTTPNGDVNVEIYLKDETIWLSQQKMAELFGVQRPAITKHLKNIFESEELDEKVVSSIMELTTSHRDMPGKTQSKKVKYYNLDAIISVGYRVNSTKVTQFRIWATKTLKNFIIKVQNKFHYAITGKTIAEIIYHNQIQFPTKICDTLLLKLMSGEIIVKYLDLHRDKITNFENCIA